MRGQGAKRRPTTETKQCPHCGKEFNTRGYGRHEQACRSCQRQEFPPGFNADNRTDPPANYGVTGGKGSITQWAHGEFIVISEAIHSHFTHQAHDEHF